MITKQQHGSDMISQLVVSKIMQAEAGEYGCQARDENTGLVYFKSLNVSVTGQFPIIYLEKDLKTHLCILWLIFTFIICIFDMISGYADFPLPALHIVAAHPRMPIRFAWMDNLFYTVIVFYCQKCKN